MHLRDHPILKTLGLYRWPPTWVEYQGPNESPPKGEVGVLRKVRCYRHNRRFVFLTIEFEGNEYIGCLMMEFEFLGEYMEMLLEACLGMSIESIGSLEVPFTFEGCNDLVPALTNHSHRSFH
jgi:hypothetical protein